MPGFVGDNPGRDRSAFPRPSNTMAWDSEMCCLRQGDAQQGGYDAMPMRRTIGISLACLVTSACAIAEAPEENATHYPGGSAGATPGSAETPTDKPRSFTCGATQERAADHGFARVERRRANLEPIPTACGGTPDPCCGLLRAAGLHSRPRRLALRAKRWVITCCYSLLLISDTE